MILIRRLCLHTGRRFVELIRYTVLMACFMVPSLFYARDFSIRTYNQENGLQNELVKTVAIDSIGFLWIGTDNGLYRYNGEEFTNYGNLLNSSYVKSLLYDSHGNLYFTTDMSFGKIVLSEGQVTARIIAEGSVSKTEGKLWYPKQLYEDHNGNIWFSDNTSVYRFHKGMLSSYPMGAHNLTSSFARSFSFFEDDRGKLGIISQTGNFYRYNPAIDIVEPVKNSYTFKNVSAVLPVANRTMLIGFNDRLGEISFDQSGNVADYRPISNAIDASTFIRSGDGTIYAGSWSGGLWKLTRDDKGNYLYEQLPEMKIRGGINQLIKNDKDFVAATDNGVVVMQQKFFRPVLQNLSSEYIYDISYDPAAKAVFSTDGQHIFRIDEETLVPEIIYTSAGAKLLQVLPSKEFLWAGDDAGFLHRIINGQVVQSYDLRKYGTSVYHLEVDDHGNLWICQDNHNGVLRLGRDDKIRDYGPADGLLSHANFASGSPFTYIFVGATGAKNFLYYFNSELNSFNNLSREIPFEYNGNISINDLEFDENGVMWLGSSHGLLRLRGNEITRPGLEELTGEEIKALSVDKNNNVWFASSTGVSKYNGTSVVTFDQSNGLPSKTINYRCLITDSKNRIWAGTLAGLSVSGNNEPPVKTATPVLLSVTKSGVPLSEISRSGFDNLSFLGFTFISPEYPAESIKYRVKIAGRDDDWKLLGGKNELMLSDLPTGSYKLLVSAKQRGNYLWSDPMVYPFSIHRVWYQTWWAWSIFIVLLALVILQGARWQSRRLEKEKRKLNKLVNERTRELELKTREIEAKNIQLLRAKEEAESSSLAKAEFLSTMSHEIKTPLHGVIGMIDLLLMENSDPEQLEKIKTLRFSAENLLSLINDILDFNKIDAGNLELESKTFKLREIVKNIKAGFEPAARNKGLEINLFYDESIPDELIGDSTRIAQILTNLTGNAIKFTESGKIDILLERRLQKDGVAEILFRIKDTGVGISPVKLENIFDTFSQANSETTRRFGGTGLGLAITKKLLELMNSRIQVKSREGIGSEFSFKLALPVSPDPSGDKHAIIASGGTMPSLKGYRILLVEDNVINIKIARQILEKWDVEVEVAKDGRLAIEMFAPGKYDLILMDLHLPEIDGYGATRRIRKRDQQIPIIALTAAAIAQEKEKVLASGMNDFVSKPFRPADLYATISRQLIKAIQ